MTTAELDRIIVELDESTAADNAALDAYINSERTGHESLVLLEKLSRTSQRHASALLAYLAACREMETP